MARRNVRARRQSVNQNPFADLASREQNPFADLGDRERRVRVASPSIADIEHRESYAAIRKRNLLDSVKDQEAIERAENPDLFDRYGEALKQTVMHPVETGRALAKGIIEPPTKILAPSKAAAASLNAPGSQPRRQLAARFGPSYLTDPEPFGKGVTGEERAGAVAQTAAMALAPGASLGRTLGMGALAGAASAPDDPLLGAAVGSTLGTAGRTLRRAPKAPAYEPPPAPKVTGAPAAAPAVPAVPAIDRFRALRFGLGDADPSMDIKVTPTGAPVRRPAPRPPVEPGPDAATASFGDPEFLPTKYRGRSLGTVTRRPGPKTANEPGTPAAEAVPYSTKGAAVRRPVGEPPPAAPAGPFDDLALAEKAETPPTPKATEAPRTFLADGPLRRTAPGEMVDGLRVGKKISNKKSIPASLTEPSVLKGVRVMAMSDFDSAPRDLFYAADDLARTEALAETIRRSGRIDPLIVVVGDKGGPYILEGGHRLGALHILGKKEFPALIVSEAADVDVRLARGEPAPGTRAALAEPFTMGDAESRIPKVPKERLQSSEPLTQPYGAFAEPPEALLDKVKRGEPLTPAEAQTVRADPELQAARPPAPKPEPAPRLPSKGREGERGLLHGESRTAGGRLRPFGTVADDALIREMTALIDKSSDAHRRSQYRALAENDMGNYQGFAATRHGKGPTEQAKALQNLKDYERLIQEIDQELKTRGHTDESIGSRATELNELEEALGREADEFQGDHDTSFLGFGEEAMAKQDAGVPPLAVPEAPNLSAEYPAGVPRAMDPKTLANAVKRTGLTDESAEAARKQILDSGYQPVRVTFAEQAKVAEQLAGTLGVDVKALRPDLAKRMSIPDMYARITRASTNVKLIEALSREVTEGKLSPDEAVNLTEAIERLNGENTNIYGDVLTAGSQKGRDLGAMRMIARLSTDPAVWEVQAMRKLGGKPLSDQVRGTVRRMAADVAAACAL